METNLTDEEILHEAERLGVKLDPRWSRDRIVSEVARARREALHQAVPDRASLIQRASRFGIHVSDSMDTERLVSLLESLDGQLADQPIAQRRGWEPGSPRG